MNIYVGNLPREITEEELQQLFAQYGQVTRTSIIKDKFTDQPRGFGFVEMATKEEGNAAIAALNGKDIKGRALKVNEAKPKNEGGRGHDRGGRGRGGRDDGTW
jgi:cold-inducible RNA-binding protein